MTPGVRARKRVKGRKTEMASPMGRPGRTRRYVKACVYTSTTRMPEVVARRTSSSKALRRPFAQPATTCRWVSAGEDALKVGGGDGVLEQAGHGHRSRAARHRGDRASHLLDVVEANVADDAGLGSRDADVD